MKPNTYPIPPLLIGGLLFLGIGLGLMFFPSKIRKFDTRVTRLIKDEEKYILTSRVFGAIFLLGSVVMLTIAVFLLIRLEM